MSLADEIHDLRNRVLSDLVDAHDYFTDTRTAWRIVAQVVEAGGTLTTRNVVTGTTTTQDNLANRAKQYVEKKVAASAFQEFLAIFEHFFVDLLRLWLTAYPRSLISKTVDFKTVLDAPDKQAITMYVVNKELNEVMYKRPEEWFAYLEERAKLGRLIPEGVERLSEAKASRDVLVHNRGIANETYERKAGNMARFKNGDRIEIPDSYLRDTWTLIRLLVIDLTDKVIAKSA